MNTGQSIVIKGDISGNEDLVIAGRVVEQVMMIAALNDLIATQHALLDEDERFLFCGDVQRHNDFVSGLCHSERSRGIP